MFINKYLSIVNTFVVIFVLLSSMDLHAHCPEKFIETTSKTFGMRICIGDQIEKQYINHAEIVLKKLLDYNSDSKPDNALVLDELISNDALFLLVNSEEQLEFFESSVDDFENFTVVFTDEMILIDDDQFDATIEEALHLITSIGYANVYPEIFGEFKGSKVSKFLDNARGGYFEDIPQKYPNHAYFTYYDATCDYSCQITEFIYWTITTLRNQQSLDWRDEEIESEWRPETPEKLELLDPDLVDFISNPKYKILY